MEQRLCIKIVPEEHCKASEIDEKLVQYFRPEALSYSDVCYWMQKFGEAVNIWKMHGDQDDALISDVSREFRPRLRKGQMYQFESGPRPPTSLHHLCSKSSRFCVV
jgi:hypothetical protein